MVINHRGEFRNSHRRRHGVTQSEKHQASGRERLCSRLFLRLIVTSPPPISRSRAKNGIIRVTGRFWHGSFRGVTVANTDKQLSRAISENGPRLNSWHTSDMSHRPFYGGEGEDWRNFGERRNFSLRAARRNSPPLRVEEFLPCN